MDTAPQDTPSPAMPDPERQAVKSHALMVHLGFSPANSWLCVAAVARQAQADLERIGIDGLAWLTAVADAAESRYAASLPPNSHQQEDHHGDGSSCRAGSTAG